MSLLFVGHPKETDLALFAGGELGPIARWRIERHLHGCDWCRDTVADFFHLQGDKDAQKRRSFLRLPVRTGHDQAGTYSP